MASLTDAEIIAELEAAVAVGESDDGFYSTRQLSALIGRGMDATRHRLRQLKRAGRLEERHLPRPNELGGGSTVMLCYRILPP